MVGGLGQGITQDDTKVEKQKSERFGVVLFVWICLCTGMPVSVGALTRAWIASVSGPPSLKKTNSTTATINC